MTILSSKLIQHFLSSIDKNLIPSVKDSLNSDLAKSVLIRFQEEALFANQCKKFFETSSMDGMSDFFLFGNFGGLFFEQNKELIMSYLDSVNDTSSVIEYIMSDIACVTSAQINLDELARAIYAPIRTNPVELDPNNKADAAYIALVRWTTRICILSVFHAFENYSEIREELLADEIAELEKGIPF